MRPSHRLKENAYTQVPDRIITYDTETYWITNEDGTKTHHLKFGVARYWEHTNKKQAPIREEFCFTDVEGFWNFVESKCTTRHKIFLFAHNAQFDSNIVGMLEYLPKRGWELEKIPIVDANIFIVNWCKGKHGCKEMGIVSDIKSIVCLDTMNFFKTSLEEIGRTLGIPKGKIQFTDKTWGEMTNEEQVELATYCKRDVEITEAIILKWYAFIKTNDLGHVQKTLASQAFGAFRHRFMKHDIYIHDNEKAIELERESYKGGRTECFQLKDINQKIYDLDFNSLYPSVMLGNLYPINLLGFRQQNDLQSLKDAMRDHIVIAELTIKVKRPLVAFRQDKLVFPIGTFTGVFCQPEIEMLLQRDCIISVGRMATYKGAKIFDEYVTFFYNERLKAKANKDTANAEMLKIMLNSLYGKFGQRQHQNKSVGSCDTTEIVIRDMINAETHEHFTRKQFGGKVYDVSRTNGESFDSFPAIASFCTSYARQKLLFAIEKAGWENVYYVDTDSLFVNQVGYDNLKDELSETELGMLKIESYGSNMFVNGCKDYVFNMLYTPKQPCRHDNPIHNKLVIRIKGIPRRAIQIGKDDYTLIKFDKFNTNLRKANATCIVERNMTKHLKREYSKGFVDRNGHINPITLSVDTNPNGKWETTLEVDENGKTIEVRPNASRRKKTRKDTNALPLSESNAESEGIKLEQLI